MVGNRQSLDALGIRQGTAKSSLWCDYLRHYEENFRPLQNQPINLIEIGIAEGNSLRMWREFFPNATIIGVDVRDSARRLASERILVEIGSQADQAFIRSVGERHPPTIVIDDASHRAPETMACFEALFPLLLPGGWYVIEDLRMFGPPEDAAVSPHEFFPKAARRMVTGGADAGGIPSADKLAHDVDCMTFINGAMLLRKRNPAAEEAALAEAERLAATVEKHWNWFFLAGTLMNREGQLDRAEAAIRKAIALNDHSAGYHHRLANILLQKRDLEGAIAAARTAAKLQPLRGDRPSIYQTRLDALLARHKRTPGR